MTAFLFYVFVCINWGSVMTSVIYIALSVNELLSLSKFQKP